VVTVALALSLSTLTAAQTVKTPRPFEPDNYRYRHILMKNPFEFHTKGTFNETDEWWNDFSTRLLIKQCPSYLARTGCVRWGRDTAYNAVWDYLYTGCNFHYVNNVTLKERTEAYCSYRSLDPALAKAYDRTTGCRLADHLNQVCNDIAATRAPYAPCVVLGKTPMCLTACPPVTGDPLVDNGEFPSCTASNYFFSCQTAVRMEMVCPSNQIFNPATELCEPCVVPVPPPTSTTTLPTPPTPTTTTSTTTSTTTTAPP